LGAPSRALSSVTLAPHPGTARFGPNCCLRSRTEGREAERDIRGAERDVACSCQASSSTMPLAGAFHVVRRSTARLLSMTGIEQKSDGRGTPARPRRAHACKCILVHAHVCMCILVHAHVCMCMHLATFMHICICTCTYARVRTCACARVHAAHSHMRMCAYVHAIAAHALIQACIRTLIHVCGH